MSARVMAVWCPDWPAVAAAQAAGHGLHEPLAVVDARGVIACNAIARTAGVRRGLRRREAQFRCPELVVVTHDATRDAVCFEPVVQSLDAVVPGIEVLRPGLLVLSAHGAVRFHGGVEQVVTGVLDAVATTDVECQVGVADELPTAVLAARQARCVDPGGDAAYLADLPVEMLTAEPALGDMAALSELVGLLRRLGVRTLGDFAHLPARDITTRFGQVAATAHRIARAVPWRPPSVSAVPVGMVIEHQCDPPLERVDEAAFLGRRLAGDVHEMLCAAGVACLRLSVTARICGGREVTRVWRCATPLTPESTADRLRWQLEGWLAGSGQVRGEDGVEVSGGAVTALLIEPVEVVPAGRIQEGLWGEAGLAEARVHRALIRAQGLLGPDAVQIPVLTGGRGPAERVQTITYGDSPAAPPSRGPWPGAIAAPSPSVVHPDVHYRLAVFSSPEAGAGITAQLRLDKAVVLRTVDGRPVAVGTRGLLTDNPGVVEIQRRQLVLRAWSRPWPVDQGWWDITAEATGQPPQARIQVVPECAAAMLLIGELGDDTGQWIVEGVYE